MSTRSTTVRELKSFGTYCAMVEEYANTASNSCSAIARLTDRRMRRDV
jgi:hypothetical protein